MQVGKEVIEMIHLHDFDDVIGVGRQRIDRHRQHHATYFRIGNDLVTEFRRQRRRHKFMVTRLE